MIVKDSDGDSVVIKQNEVLYIRAVQVNAEESSLFVFFKNQQEMTEVRINAHEVHDVVEQIDLELN